MREDVYLDLIDPPDPAAQFFAALTVDDAVLSKLIQEYDGCVGAS